MLSFLRHYKILGYLHLAFIKVVNQVFIQSKQGLINRFEITIVICAVSPKPSLDILPYLLRLRLEMGHDWLQFYSIILNLVQYCVEGQLID